MKNTVSIEIPPGELIDRISILLLKLLNMQCEAPHIQDELKVLLNSASVFLSDRVEEDHVVRSIIGLFAVNRELWDKEDEVRSDDAFTFEKAAGLIPELNDFRSSLKRMINDLFDSGYNESKTYKV